MAKNSVPPNSGGRSASASFWSSWEAFFPGEPTRLFFFFSFLRVAQIRVRLTHNIIYAWTRGVRLTLGLMGLDELHLRVLSTSSDDEAERKNAAQGAPQILGGRAVGIP